jgi:hypothetical protein
MRRAPKQTLARDADVAKVICVNLRRLGPSFKRKPYESRRLGP